MPKVTRWMIKAGMVCLVAGVTLALAADLSVTGSQRLLLPVYWHLIVLGWITQLIMAVAIWMFPRRNRSRRKENTALAWAALWCLNGGILLRVISEPLIHLTEHPAITAAAVISAILPVAAVFCFTLEIWPRLKPKKKKISST
jgi:hypothetical protein